jgi:hypothetical protein
MFARKDENRSRLSTLLSLAGSLNVLAVLWDWVEDHLAPSVQSGMYEVLDFDAHLELHDTDGKVTTLAKTETVKFLQDNIIAYQDQAWGHGDIFSTYQCAPGHAVDRYQEGNHYRILISLRESKQRGDTETFHITRTIEDGFTEETEFFQTRIEHKTRKLSMRVTFPMRRFPQSATLLEQNANRTTPLGSEHIQSLPNGQQRISWQIDHPRRFEVYSIRWTW